MSSVAASSSSSVSSSSSSALAASASSSSEKVFLVTLDDLRSHPAYTFDLVTLEDLQPLEVDLRISLSDFKHRVAEVFGIQPEHQRYWPWVRRQNKTTRPGYSPIPQERESEPLSSLGSRSLKNAFWLEHCLDPQNTPAVRSGAAIAETHSLIFFKYYDPYRETLEYCGHRFVSLSSPVRALEELARGFRGIEEGTELLLFEEVKPTMVDLLNMDLTISGAELGIGDIVVFQQAVDPSEKKFLNLSLASDWYAKMRDQPQEWYTILP